jgi:hypothetical protein
MVTTVFLQKIIKTALRKMVSSDLSKQAVQCFRNITGFMGDRTTTKEVRGGEVGRRSYLAGSSLPCAKGKVPLPCVQVWSRGLSIVRFLCRMVATPRSC